MRIFLAEKPSLAHTIADALGNSKRKNGYFACGSEEIVTWCFGHLLEMAQPEAYDPSWANRYNSWQLPMVPEKFTLIPREDSGVREQLAIIGDLVRKASVVVNAGDPDREGQLLVDEVLDYVHYTGPTLRIFLPSLDPKSVAKALATLQENTKFRSWRDAAQTRRSVDWLGGINMSRAMTIFGQSVGLDGVLSLGRVQTPTLRLVVDREREIKNFVPVEYARLLATIIHKLGTFQATFVPAEDLPGVDSEGRLVDFAQAARIQEDSCKRNGTITSVTRKQQKEPPKLPYALASLQEECGAKFGMGAQRVLDIAQKLYEAKYTTYPRTDCEYLPKEQLSDAPSIIEALGKRQSLCEAARGANPTLISRAWDTKKVTAHHAIIPTGILPTFLGQEEAQVYDLIALRYLLQFWPAFEYEATKVQLRLDNDTLWEASGRVIKKPGWTALVRPDKEGEPPLPRVAKADPIQSTDVALQRKHTTPPSHFTEGTLIKAMKTIHRFVQDPQAKAKLRETSGLGTEATRAGILETLKRRGYLINKGKTLLPTTKGENVIDLCPESMKDIVTTAILEDVLSDVQAGKVAADEAVKTYVETLRPMVKEVLTQDTSRFSQLTCTPCPSCQRPITRIFSKKTSAYFWVCNNPSCRANYTDDNGKIGTRFYRGEVSKTLVCPRCQKPLVRRQRKDGSGFFWSCSGYPACTWSASDHDGKPVEREKVTPPIEDPFFCPLCGHKLSFGKSAKTGKPYWACFNKAPEHGMKAKFFNVLANGAPDLTTRSFPSTRAYPQSTDGTECMDLSS